MINHSYTPQEYEWATMVWRAQRKQEAEEAECGSLQAVSPAERQTVRPSAMQTDKLSWATKRLIN